LIKIFVGVTIGKTDWLLNYIFLTVSEGRCAATAGEREGAPAEICWLHVG